VQNWHWLQGPVEDAARRLLGCELVHAVDGETLRVRIVETEAYDQLDPASHAFHGRTAANDAMFRSAGHAYVYLSHGIHHCLNVVTGQEGFGCGALVRAAEPVGPVGEMTRRRGRDGVQLTNGPGKLCQALAVTRALTGHDLTRPPLRLIERPALPDDEVVTTTRIGISRAVEAPRRFYIRGNPYVSRS